MASWTSPRASLMTLPISSVISRANCSLRSSMIWPTDRGSRRAWAPGRVASLEGACGGVDRDLDVLRGALDIGGDELTCGGIRALVGLARLGIDPFAVDVSSGRGLPLVFSC